MTAGEAGGTELLSSCLAVQFPQEMATDEDHSDNGHGIRCSTSKTFRKDSIVGSGVTGRGLGSSLSTRPFQAAQTVHMSSPEEHRSS